MEFLDKFIQTVGVNTIVIGGVAILVAILFLFLYRFIKLKVYRKELVALENLMNAVKTLPIQYRLGRVQGISKNIPKIAEKYDEYLSEFERLSDFQAKDIAMVIVQIDDRLFYRKLKGTKSDLRSLKENIEIYEKKSKTLLKNVEEITEVENVQRVEIIKIKEKYRSVHDVYVAVQFKIENFVPAMPEMFNDIDQRFVALEDLMNKQKFNEANTFALEIEKDIEAIEKKVADLPTYISIVRKYIPKRLADISTKIEEMSKQGFSLDTIDTSTRYNMVSKDLEDTIVQIKLLQLDNIGQKIETMTEDINSLTNDFEKEETAFNAYQVRRETCYKQVRELDEGLKETLTSLNELHANYMVDINDFDVASEYESFTSVLDELADITAIIEKRNFSYTTMIERFDDVLEMCKPYETSLNTYKELKESLRLQEKRALDELDNINIVLLEIKSEIKNKHLPMINESYKDYIADSYEKAEEILTFTRQRPIDLQRLSNRVDAARDVIYKLYDNVHNLIVTAEMVEDAIVYGNRYRSTFLEVNTELTKAELLFRNGEYTKALTTAVDIIEKIKPGSYETLVNNNKEKV